MSHINYSEAAAEHSAWQWHFKIATVCLVTFTPLDCMYLTLSLSKRAEPALDWSVVDFAFKPSFSFTYTL